MRQVTIRKGREKPLLAGHPWVFSGAIERVAGAPEPGEVVRVVDAAGGFIAWGYYNPHSQIVCRLLEWSEPAQVDDGWWDRRIHDALSRRSGYLQEGHNTACRLCHAESDGLPGLIIDKYDRHLVIQVLTAGVERVKPVIISALTNELQPLGIIERSDQKSRKLEGLSSAHGLLTGEMPDGPVTIFENGLRFLVDLDSGQKTGFYLDQRINHARVAAYASGADVFDGFCYSGAFTLHALRAGAAHVTAVDTSAPAIELLKRNAALNFPDAAGINKRLDALCADVFAQLRAFRDTGRQFDLVILDPPKLAPTRAAAERAMRSYKDLNLWAMSILRPGGILATFSCSGGVSAERFQEAVWWAAIDARRDVQILERLTQSPDHPVRLSFPESEYLKGMVCRVG